MTIGDKIRDEKLQYDINREAAKISALSSGKIDKYEDRTGEEILLSDQSRMIEQTKFIYYPLGEVFEKQIKIQNQGRKQVGALKALNPTGHQQKLKSVEEFFPKDLEKNEIKNEFNENKNIGRRK